MNPIMIPFKNLSGKRVCDISENHDVVIIKNGNDTTMIIPIGNGKLDVVNMPNDNKAA